MTYKKMNNWMKTFFAALCMVPLAACGGSDDPDPNPNPDPDPGTGSLVEVENRYVGADISLLAKYEQNGAKYLYDNGSEIKNVLTYFNSKQMDVMRVRLFVDPTKAPEEEKGQGVCQDLAYVTALAQRIKHAGFKLMLDIHYSDSWADPAKQYTPAAWEDLGDDELKGRVYTYTRNVLKTLNQAGATPDFIQTGNEISYGMMWGKRSNAGNEALLKKCYTNSDANWVRLAQLLGSATQACRETCPEAKIVFHTERVAQPDVLYAFYQRLAAFNMFYDIIGLSYYPIYHGSLATLDAAITGLEERFPSKEIMIVETGYHHAYAPQNPSFDYSATYPVNAEGQRKFTADLITMLKQHKRVSGLLWWWAEANEFGLDWDTKRVTDEWYNASLFDNETGKELPAIDELKNFE